MDQEAGVEPRPRRRGRKYPRSGRWLFVGLMVAIIVVGIAMLHLWTRGRQEKLAKRYMKLGTRALQEGRINEAVKHFERAAAYCPGRADCRYNLGVALGKVGEWHRAADCFREAARLAPDAPRAWWNLSESLINLEDYAGSEQAMTEFLARKPDFALAWQTRAFARLVTQKHKGAAADFREYVRRAPNEKLMVFWLFLAEARAGSDARASLRKSTAEWKAPPLLLALRDLYLGELSASAFAARHISAASVSKEQRSIMSYYLAQHHRLAGKKSAAIAAFKTCLATDTPNSIEHQAAEIELKRLGQVADLGPFE